jgi:2'-5' RNA ligase
MTRLFIALETPSEVTARLLLTVPSGGGIRPVPAEQVHLTLRFLGECDDALCARVAQALTGVQAPAFAMAVEGAGRFRGGQGCVLWAGIAANPALDALYANIGQALDGAGIAPERRRFHPHLTVARCRPSVPEGAVRDWLAAQRELSTPPWQVDRFILFESRLGPRGAQHLVSQAVPLITPDC